MVSNNKLFYSSLNIHLRKYYDDIALEEKNIQNDILQNKQYLINEQYLNTFNKSSIQKSEESTQTNIQSQITNSISNPPIFKSNIVYTTGTNEEKESKRSLEEPVIRRKILGPEPTIFPKKQFSLMEQLKERVKNPKLRKTPPKEVYKKTISPMEQQIQEKAKTMSNNTVDKLGYAESVGATTNSEAPAVGIMPNTDLNGLKAKLKQIREYMQLHKMPEVSIIPSDLRKLKVNDANQLLEQVHEIGNADLSTLSGYGLLLKKKYKHKYTKKRKSCKK